jgi:YidC/Oxa1 family membrane protein insertase
MNDQNNTNIIIAIVLSALVMIGWTYFMKQRQDEVQRQQPQITQTQPAPQGQSAPGQAQPGHPSAPSVPSTAPVSEPKSREAALASAPRIAISTPKVTGSISLKGGRIDDVSLGEYHETVDPKSPNIELLSPSGSPSPFYAQFGWVLPPGSEAKTPLPSDDTVWTQEGSGALTPAHPVTLRYDNGQGLEFRRTISVDDRYLFTLKDEVVNNGQATVSLHPYALISRHGTPALRGFAMVHEGLIGVMGDQGVQEITYKDIESKKLQHFSVTNAWMGITDTYWAAALLPDTSAHVQADFRFDQDGAKKTYQTGYALDPVTVAPGAKGSASGRLFAGAKEVGVVGLNFPFAGVGGYNLELGLNKFDQLIDWGRLFLITKPMFLLLDGIYRFIGNFGVAILLVTALLKLVFFPLANKQYASMAKMKALAPQMKALQERYADDKVKYNQEVMELYKREGTNPVTGCLPILIQIPVFFALYKVLLVSIEMRHAPFFGWIHDLSSPDPTNLFNLFGLLPFDPSHLPFVGSFLVLGAWPLFMGVTMWVQMKLNPAPPDPAQKIMFDWMPVIFTFMLANFPSGLVIYWAWNNLLTVGQQSFIMHRNGAKVELFDNLRDTFFKRAGAAPAKAPGAGSPGQAGR